MLKKFKEWIGTGLDVYKVENANDIAPGLVRHIWKGEETATQIGTTLKAQIMKKNMILKSFGRRMNIQKIFLKIQDSLLRIINISMILMSAFIWFPFPAISMRK